MTTGVELFEQGRKAEAYPLLKREAAAETPPGLAHFYLSVVEAEMADSPHALLHTIDQVSGTVAVDWVCVTVGATAYDLGLREQGLDLMRKAVTTNPRPESIRMFVSRLDNHPEHVGEAIDYYRSLLEAAPEDAFALRGMAGRLELEGRLDEAEPLYRRAVESDPEDASTRYNYGNFLCLQQRFEAALEQFRAAVDYEFEFIHMAYAGIGYCQYKLGNLVAARQAALQAWHIAPGYGYALDILAETGCVGS